MHQTLYKVATLLHNRLQVPFSLLQNMGILRCQEILIKKSNAWVKNLSEEDAMSKKWSLEVTKNYEIQIKSSID